MFLVVVGRSLYFVILGSSCLFDCVLECVLCLFLLFVIEGVGSMLICWVLILRFGLCLLLLLCVVFMWVVQVFYWLGVYVVFMLLMVGVGSSW